MVSWACCNKPPYGSGPQICINDLTITKSPDCLTGEEEDPLQLLVVKEVVERPQGAFFSIRVRVQVWIVTVGE